MFQVPKKKYLVTQRKEEVSDSDRKKDRAKNPTFICEDCNPKIKGYIPK